MMKRLMTGLALLLGCLLPLGGALSRADVSQLSENQVKAAYLFNFAKYAEWPAAAFASPAAPLVIGIIGKGPTAEAHAALAGRQIHGRKVQVRQLARVEETAGCHLLFIAASERPRLKEILKALPATGVLTVSDIKQFCSLGGMIGLVPRGEKVQFEINLGNAERAGLRLSSQMLKLALSVYD